VQPQSTPTPDHILHLGFGFMASKVLLSAVELGLFSELAPAALDADAIGQRLGLHPRGLRDFLDALVALGMLARNDGLYSNTPDTSFFLDRVKPAYLGGLLEMFNGRLYNFYGSLTEALKTGQPQNESKQGGENIFGQLYSDPTRLRQFLGAMTGISLGSGRALAAKFPWKDYRTFADIGCAQGACPVQIALAHPHLNGVGFDLPQVQPIFEEYVASLGLSGRLHFQPGSFFSDPLPSADVLVMGHILHNWNLETKRMLLGKACQALPSNGALIVYETIIDDDRRENATGLIMSLTMLIETDNGVDFTGAECRQWMKDAGFRETRVEHLAGPESMVIGIK
jgi:O-methyltransferase/methyltransferase family protein